MTMATRMLGCMIAICLTTMSASQDLGECDKHLVKFLEYSPSIETAWMCQSQVEVLDIVNKYAACIEGKKGLGRDDYNLAVSNLDIMQTTIGLLSSFDKVEALRKRLQNKGLFLDGTSVVKSASTLRGSYGVGPGQYVCTTFVAKALRDAGFVVDDAVSQVINIRLPSHFTESPAELAKLVRNRDPRIKGAVTALVATKQGVEINVSNVKAGDIVQYWTTTASAATGHAAVVSKTHPDGSVDLLGSHLSRGGVGTLTRVKLSQYTAFAVRPAIE